METLAGRYELGDALGQGRSTVFRAVDTRLRREVAIKRVQLLAGQEDAHQVRTRALREAQASARLNNPGVVTVYDVVEEDGAIWLVMELVAGPSLAQVVADEGPLPAPRAAAIGLGVLTALEAAHLVGVVHRDVKPANVLITGGDRAKLTDFGVATIRDESRVTATGLIVGSPSYMAPEQATGGEITASTDLWALGAMLYFSVEGTPPFQAGSALATASAVVHGEPRPQQNPGPLTPVIDRLLVKDPATRARAGEIRAALTRIARDERRRRRPRRDPAAGATQLMPATPQAFEPVPAPPAADPEPSLAPPAASPAPVPAPPAPPEPSPVSEPSPAADPEPGLTPPAASPAPIAPETASAVPPESTSVTPEAAAAPEATPAATSESTPAAPEPTPEAESESEPVPAAPPDPMPETPTDAVEAAVEPEQAPTRVEPAVPAATAAAASSGAEPEAGPEPASATESEPPPQREEQASTPAADPPSAVEPERAGESTSAPETIGGSKQPSVPAAVAVPTASGPSTPDTAATPAAAASTDVASGRPAGPTTEPTDSPAAPSPTSVGGDADVPAAGGLTPQRRRLVLIVAGVVALLLAAVIIPALGDDDDDEAGTGSSPTTEAPSGDTEPPPSDETTVPETTETTAAPTTATTAAEGALPAGWAPYADPQGTYTIGLPPGWEVRPTSNANRIDLVEPATGSFLRIEWVSPPNGDPVGAWRASAANPPQPGYEEIRIEPVAFRDYDAAMWEFRHDSGPVLHTGNLGFVANGRGYALMLRTPEDRWEASQPLFEQFKQAFQPT